MSPFVKYLTAVMLVYMLTHYQVECAKRSVQLKLLTDLMDKYDSPALRPVNDTAEAVFVGFRFAPIVTSLDSIAQQLHVHGIYLIRWRDDRLAWDPLDYDGLREIHMPLFKDGASEPTIWRPEMVLYESIRTSPVSFQPEIQTVKVNHTGDILWFTIANTNSECTVIVRYYPFDDQICNMTFTTWVYKTNEQIFSVFGDITDTNAYKEYEVKSEIWNVAIQDVKVANASYECLTCEAEEQSYVLYTLKLSRANQHLYLIILMLPCLVMSGMTLVVIWLPRDDVTAAAGFGVTCILTFNVYLTYLFGQLPLTGLPLIGDYIAWLMVEAVIITIYGVNRAAKERSKKSNIDGKGSETTSSESKTSDTSSAKTQDDVKCVEEQVDGGFVSKDSIKFTTLPKENDIIVQADADEETSIENQGSDLQVRGQSLGCDELRQGAFKNGKENLGQLKKKAEIHHLNWRCLTVKQAMLCIKFLTSLFVLTIALIYVFV